MFLYGENAALACGRLLADACCSTWTGAWGSIIICTSKISTESNFAILFQREISPLCASDQYVLYLNFFNKLLHPSTLKLYK